MIQRATLAIILRHVILHNIEWQSMSFNLFRGAQRIREMKKMRRYNCAWNRNITDVGLSDMEKLMSLEHYINKNITGEMMRKIRERNIGCAKNKTICG